MRLTVVGGLILIPAVCFGNAYLLPPTLLVVACAALGTLMKEVRPLFSIVRFIFIRRVSMHVVGARLARGLCSWMLTRLVRAGCVPAAAGAAGGGLREKEVLALFELCLSGQHVTVCCFRCCKA